MLAIVFAAAVATAHTPAAAMTSNLFRKNLVVNGGAESGPAAPEQAVYVSIPGWSKDGLLPPMNVISYGYDDFPATGAPGPADRGKRLFFGGVMATAAETQAINLAAASSAIDKGTVHFTFSAYLGGFAGQADYAMVTLRLLPSGVTRQLGPVTTKQRNSATGLFLRSISGTVPQGTRSAQITMRAFRNEGTSNDGYVDNISLILKP